MDFNENEEPSLPTTGPMTHLLSGVEHLISKELERRDKEQSEMMSSLREKIEELQASNESKDRDIEASEQENEQLKQEVLQSKEENAALKADNEQLKREVEESREEKEKTIKSMRLDEETTTLTFKKQIAEHKKEAKKLRRKVAELKDSNQSLEKMYKSVQNQAESAEKANNDYRDRIGFLEKKVKLLDSGPQSPPVKAFENADGVIELSDDDEEEAEDDGAFEAAPIKAASPSSPNGSTGNSDYDEEEEKSEKENEKENGGEALDLGVQLTEENEESPAKSKASKSNGVDQIFSPPLAQRDQNADRLAGKTPFPSNKRHDEESPRSNAGCKEGADASELVADGATPSNSIVSVASTGSKRKSKVGHLPNGFRTATSNDLRIPGEPAVGLPDGWLQRRFRKKGTTEKVTYFYSPELNLRFNSNSKLLVTRFLTALDNAGGDEAVAVRDYRDLFESTSVAGSRL